MHGSAEILLRSLGTLIILFIITRILGKKQISQLTFFEYILGIVLGELAGFLSTDVESNYVHGLLALSVWVVIPFMLELLTLKSKTVRQWLEGKGRIMIKDGRVLEDNLKKERLTADELLEQLRGRNVFRLSDVEFAVMETNGDLDVLLKRNKQPLSPSDLNIDTEKEAEPQTVIMDGEILDTPLQTMGLSRRWLQQELNKHSMAVEDVFLAQVDSKGQLYLDGYEHRQKPAPKR